MYKSGKRALANIALLVMMIISLAACGDDSANPNSNAAPGGATQGINGQDNSSKSDSGPVMDTSTAGMVQQAVNNMKALKSYHLDITTTDGAGKTTATTSADVDAANNRLKLDTTESGQTTSVLVVSDTTYVSTDGGKTYSANPDGVRFAAPVQAFVKMWSNYNPSDADKAKVKVAGSDQINGVAAQHLSADIYNLGGIGLTVNNTKGANVTGTIELWVAATNPPTIPQMRCTTVINRVFTIIMLKWSKLNAAVNIVAPAK